MRGEWIVTYDISSDQARARVARLLELHGHRLQYSVWLVALGPGAALRLFERISDLSGRSDKVLMVPACAVCDRATVGSPVEQLGPLVMVPPAGSDSR